MEKIWNLNRQNSNMKGKMVTQTKWLDTETKWRTQKQNGGHRKKMTDPCPPKTKRRTHKQNSGHRIKMADTEAKWRT